MHLAQILYNIFIYIRRHGRVVRTSVSHSEGPRFNPRPAPVPLGLLVETEAVGNNVVRGARLAVERVRPEELDEDARAETSFRSATPRSGRA